MPQKLKSESERDETKYKMFETNIYNFNNKVQFYEIEVLSTIKCYLEHLKQKVEIYKNEISRKLN